MYCTLSHADTDQQQPFDGISRLVSNLTALDRAAQTYKQRERESKRAMHTQQTAATTAGELWRAAVFVRVC
jgi:hypothetical protein